MPKDYEFWKTVSELVGDAIIKRTNPIADELSRHQAETIYGAQFIRDAIGSGKIKGYRKGSGKTSPLIFSRHELDCLRAEQRNIKAELI